MKPNILLIKSGRSPWRDSVKSDIIHALSKNPNQIPIIQTPNGLLPFDLEDWALFVIFKHSIQFGHLFLLLLMKV